MERPFFTKADCQSFMPVEAHSIEKQKDRFTTTAASLEEAKGIVMESPKWLPIAAESYRISANLKDYILVPVISIVSDLPNRNAHAFSRKTLSSWVPDRMQVMGHTFQGVPVHYEHCFPASAPIRVSNGYKPISEIEVGDSVLTHKGRYKRVSKLYNNGKKWVSEVVCSGLSEPIYTTENHPFWVIGGQQIYGNARFCRDSVIRKRSYHIESLAWEDLKPHWRKATDIYKGDFLVAPICIGGDISVPSPFAFLTGVFMAEGSYEKYKGEVAATILTIGTSEVAFRERILKACEKLGLKYSVCHHKINQSTTIRIAGRDFAAKMYELCGDYAHLKSMRGDLRKWNKESLKWFLGGYIEGDGSVDKQYRVRFRCRTVSKELSNDIWQAFLSLGIRAFVNKDITPYEKTYICPRYNKRRVLRAKASYSIKAVDVGGLLNKYTVAKKVDTSVHDPNRKTYDRIILTEHHILMPVTSIRHKVKEERVYNIEVDKDHSYVAYNVIVHNCNKDYTKAKGIVLSSILKNMPHSKGNLIKVVNLLAIDRNRDPVLANAILTGEMNSYSMGAYTRDYRTTCCGALATKGGCEHLKNPMAGKFHVFPDGRISFWQTVDPSGFEISSVRTGAYVSATQDKVTNLADEM